MVRALAALRQCEDRVRFGRKFVRFSLQDLYRQ
jgi:hypothetical protein